MEGGMRALLEVANKPNRPSAVICSNDMTAIGVLREAYEYGIEIPADLSVVGFDDIRLAQFMTPPLTTIQMSQSLLAELAFNALIGEVEKVETTVPRKFDLVTTLVLRRTTALAPTKNKRGKPAKAEGAAGTTNLAQV